MSQKKTIIAFSLFIIAIVAVSGGMYWSRTSEETPFLPVQEQASEEIKSLPVQEELKEADSVNSEIDENTKLYASAQFDYSFEYPQYWFVTELSGSKDQPEVVLISKQVLTEGTESDTEVSITINRSSLEDNMRNNLITREEIVFAGKPATKIYFQGDFGAAIISILIPQNDYTFVISYDPADEDYAGIETIVNSFLFRNK